MTLNIMVMFIFVLFKLLTDFGVIFMNFEAMPINAQAYFAKNWERCVSCACPPPILHPWRALIGNELKSFESNAMGTTFIFSLIIIFLTRQTKKTISVM